MEKYVNQIPLLVRNSLKALSDKNRQGILIYLEKKGHKSFINIHNDLEIPKNNLSHHIKVLMRYGLLYNFYEKNEFDDRYSFYELSKLGKRFINILLNFLKNFKMLIVDDDIEMRKDFRKFFENRNCIVDEAKNGLEALNKVQETNYDIIILDLKMPVMSGEKFLENVNKLQIELRSTYILSGHLDNDSKERYTKFGVKLLLEKPYNLKELYNTIIDPLLP